MPVPFVADGIAWAIDAGLGKARERSHKKKLVKYQAAVDALEPGETSPAQDKLLKFQIKDIDIKHLEESVRKAKNNMDKYNAVKCGSDQDCKKAAELAYRYARAKHRIEVLEAEALALQSVAEAIALRTQEWLSKVEDCYPSMVETIVNLTNHEEKCKAGSACFCELQASQSLLAFADSGDSADG